MWLYEAVSHFAWLLAPVPALLSHRHPCTSLVSLARDLIQLKLRLKELNLSVRQSKLQIPLFLAAILKLFRYAL